MASFGSMPGVNANIAELFSHSVGDTQLSAEDAFACLRHLSTPWSKQWLLDHMVGGHGMDNIWIIDMLGRYNKIQSHMMVNTIPYMDNTIP